MYVEPASMREVTLEKHLYTRTHATNHNYSTSSRIGPTNCHVDRHLGVSQLVVWRYYM